MVSKQTCSSLIVNVKDSFSNPEDAYLARTRLKRLILACIRMIAGQYGLKEPDLPGLLTPPPDASLNSQEMADICNRLMGMTHTLCQRSEPLDCRWKSGWEKVLQELDRMETLLA
jgi:hypothetical protein